MAASRVVIIRVKGIHGPDRALDKPRLRKAFELGLQRLAGVEDLAGAVRSRFSASDKVGIKINAIAGRSLTTRPEVALSLASVLTDGGVASHNITIWDRTNRELRDAGYRLSLSAGPKVFGTDTAGVDYEEDLVSQGNIGSRFSAIQARLTTASISLALLKDHGMAGVTAGMKNYYGAVHNPNKYHDTNCNPYVAELFATAPIRSKHRLTVVDALLVQYHRGPSHHARWAESYEALLLGLDPVATDVLGWRIIEELRARKGLPGLKEEEREPAYLFTAERMGLGTARLENIQRIEVEA